MLKEMFLGKKAEDLSRLIADQSETLFKLLQIDVPVKSASIVLVLDQYECLSVTEIADKLEHSRQLIIQKLPKLVGLGLLKQLKDTEDKRRKVYCLTDEGINQAKKIINIQQQLEQIYNGLYNDMNLNLFHHIDVAIGLMQSKTLIDRFNEQNNY